MKLFIAYWLKSGKIISLRVEIAPATNIITISFLYALKYGQSLGMPNQGRNFIVVLSCI